MPLCPLLAVMELRGICIDTTEMIRSGQVLKVRMLDPWLPLRLNVVLVRTIAISCQDGSHKIVVLRNKHLHFVTFLTHRPPPCSNGPAFTFMCHILRFCAMSSVILNSFMSSLMLSSHLFLGLPFSLSLHLHSYHLLGGILPFLP